MELRLNLNVLKTNTRESTVAETKMNLICIICMEYYRTWLRGQSLLKLKRPNMKLGRPTE